MELFGRTLKFNGFEVYHGGNKPKPGDIGAYTKEEVNKLLAEVNGTKITVSGTQPQNHIQGQVWIQINA